MKLARAARAAIKGADPSATVVMAGFADRSWELIPQVYRAGGKGIFDVVAIHPYTFKVANVVKIVTLVRAALRKAGDPGRPLWATEVTWSSGQGKVAHPLGFETTASDQARRLAAALPALAKLRRSQKLERIYWESWATRDANRGNPFDFSGPAPRERERGGHRQAGLQGLRALRQALRARLLTLRAQSVRVGSSTPHFPRRHRRP